MRRNELAGLFSPPSIFPRDFGVFRIRHRRARPAGALFDNQNANPRMTPATTRLVRAERCFCRGTFKRTREPRHCSGGTSPPVAEDDRAIPAGFQTSLRRGKLGGGVFHMAAVGPALRACKKMVSNTGVNRLPEKNLDNRARQGSNRPEIG